MEECTDEKYFMKDSDKNLMSVVVAQYLELNQTASWFNMGNLTDR